LVARWQESAKMQDKESPFVRYRRLARESLEVAKTAHGEQRETFLQMAQVWQRLADQYTDATPTSSQPNSLEQPVMQQQQQIQFKDDDENKP
jgi:hypothetical protein